MTGISSPLGGPNCFRAAEYLTAIVIALTWYAKAIFIMVTLPADSAPKDAPALTRFEVRFGPKIPGNLILFQDY